MLRVYNTLTGKKEEFHSLVPGKVRMYNCGPTVYDYFHAGNARNFIVFDVIKRYLKYKGYEVTFVQNITDIDDKIINRANKEKVSAGEIAHKYTDAFFEDLKILDITKPDICPKATEHVPDIISLIKRLMDAGFAYQVDEDVFFEVGKFSDYGKLSKRPLDEMKHAARVEIDKRKKQPSDFALWKRAKPNEPSWNSPWGKGRPGWHVECSAMSMKYLGETFDIHSGGQDLIFPHHENEIAQSEAATGKPFVKYWLHNGFLNINGEKMSKSLGNFFLVRDILKRFRPQVVRYFMISAHYRSPLDFSDESLAESGKALERIENCFDNIRENAKDLDTPQKNIHLEWMNKFEEAMDDDFNTASALGVVFDLITEINSLIADKSRDSAQLKQNILNLETFCSILGILPRIEDKELDRDLLDLIKERTKARRKRDWQGADRIRSLLEDRGVILKDNPDGTTSWKQNNTSRH
ncbi:cysteine--tRNA ligase [bacterium]|nr:cysteine--tRNA ligase [bacterium]